MSRLGTKSWRYPRGRGRRDGARCVISLPNRAPNASHQRNSVPIWHCTMCYRRAASMDESSFVLVSFKFCTVGRPVSRHKYQSVRSARQQSDVHSVTATYYSWMQTIGNCRPERDAMDHYNSLSAAQRDLYASLHSSPSNVDHCNRYCAQCHVWYDTPSTPRRPMLTTATPPLAER
jgi:hypothetical protein